MYKSVILLLPATFVAAATFCPVGGTSDKLKLSDGVIREHFPHTVRLSLGLISGFYETPALVMTALLNFFTVR